MDNFFLGIPPFSFITLFCINSFFIFLYKYTGLYIIHKYFLFDVISFIADDAVSF